MRKLRIVIADDESLRLMSLRSQLRELGHEVVGEASNGADAVSLTRHLRPDLAILDIKMPEVNGIEAARMITAESPLPLVFLTAFSDEALAQEAASVGSYAYLVKPVTQEELVPAIAMAMAKFREFQELRRGIDELKESLEARKLIERAKGILMERRNIGEAEAFRRMQKRSQNENKKLVEIAKAIVTADSML